MKNDGLSCCRRMEVEKVVKKEEKIWIFRRKDKEEEK